MGDGCVGFSDEIYIEWSMYIEFSMEYGGIYALLYRR